VPLREKACGKSPINDMSKPICEATLHLWLIDDTTLFDGFAESQ
jgi:hypothetical protein